MLKNILIPLFLALLLVGCGAQPAAELVPPASALPTNLPTETPRPTETALPDPTATLIATETPSIAANVFGTISAADAPAGFMLEPIAQAIFEAKMQKRVETGEIGGVSVEALSIVPRGDGTFFAEIFYTVQADASFWAEDFGTPADDGWVRGKCTRFDFEMGEDAYALKNKAVCN